MKRHKRLSFTVRYVLIFGILLLSANFILGIVVLNESNASVRALIDKSMLNIANTAADMLDGDALRDFREDDVGGAFYDDCVEKLSAFTANADIHFIYIVREADDGRFVFIIDPDPEEPADYGEEIVTTDGLVRAGGGTPAVDGTTEADRWGNFYSAYSPVMDSDGRVASVVGIDFDAEWFKAMVRQYTFTISLITVAALLAGCVIVAVMTGGVRRRFQQLDDGLSSLSRNMDQLLGEMETYSGSESRAGEQQAQSGDEIEALGEKIQTMQRDMRRYLDYLQEKAYIDSLTRVGNATAYHDRLQALDADIRRGAADFMVVVLDVNGLKETNDNHGHECGDSIIEGAANAISAAFGAQNVYRIGGDEFAVVLAPAEEQTLGERLARLDAEVEAFNASKRPFDVALSLSRGSARYRPGEDVSYKEVFARADQRMYLKKREHYQGQGNRRRLADAPD